MSLLNCTQEKKKAERTGRGYKSLSSISICVALSVGMGSGFARVGGCLETSSVCLSLCILCMLWRLLILMKSSNEGLGCSGTRITVPGES